MFLEASTIPRIGHARIDAGHDDLARRINALYEMWRGGIEPAALAEGFHLFLRAVGRHFVEEEEIAAAAGYPHLDAHAARHVELLASLTDLVDCLARQMCDGEVGDRFIDVFSFIDAALHEHEIMDDQDYWPYFRDDATAGMTLGTQGGTLVEWSDDLRLGHGEMDRQHRDLVGGLNALAGLLTAGASTAQVEAALTVVIGHTRSHFAWEERQMLDLGEAQERVQVHVLLHRSLLCDLEQVADQVRAGLDAEGAGALRMFLRYWFLDHVRNVDGALARALVAAPAPDSVRAAGPGRPRPGTVPESSPWQAVFAE